MKSQTGKQIHNSLRLNFKPVVVRHLGMRRVEYKGYTIKVFPPLTPTGKTHCYIGRNDVGEAFRQGIDKAKLYIDEQIRKTIKLKCKVKVVKTAPVVLECVKCGGMGLYRNRVCSMCEGKGTRQ